MRSGEVYFFQIRSAGGAVNDVPVDATAYAHRPANFRSWRSPRPGTGSTRGGTP